MSSIFEDILNSSLEAVLAGSETVNSCCARYPGEADRLRPLLTLALGSREALRVDEVPEDARAAGREKLLSHIKEAKKPPRQRLGLGQRMFVRPIALGAGAVMMLSTGTALAASTAGPGSFLYPLEQKLESAHTALTVGKLDKAQVEISHANERLTELEAVVADGKPEYAPEVLGHYEDNINHASGLVKDAADEGEDTVVVEGMLGATRDRLAGIIADNEARLPDDVKSAARDALKKSNEDVGELPGAENSSSEHNGGDQAGPANASGESDVEHSSGDSGGNHDSESGGGSGESGSGGDMHQDSQQSEPSQGGNENHDTGSSESSKDGSHPSEQNQNGSGHSDSGHSSMESSGGNSSTPMKH